jgi:hypothetical protein
MGISIDGISASGIISASGTIEGALSQLESPTAIAAIAANTNVNVMILLVFMLNLLYFRNERFRRE